MSEPTRAAVDTFWSMITFLANALLFLLVGTDMRVQFIFLRVNMTDSLFEHIPSVNAKK